MAKIALTAGDTLPTRLTYKTAKGAVINISGYSFAVHIGYDPTPLNRAATIVDAANGVLEIPWQAGDLTVGEFPLEILVINATGKTKTMPLGTVVIGARIV